MLVDYLIRYVKKFLCLSFCHHNQNMKNYQGNTLSDLIEFMNNSKMSLKSPPTS